jgi:hypothetical protein
MQTRRFVSVVLSVVAGAVLSGGCDGDSSGSNGGGGGGPGGGAAPAVRAPVAQPIKAVFTQATFSTKYEVTFSNPDEDELTFDWSGPNCGQTAVSEPKTCSAKDCKSDMTWTHPHPPCEASPTHDDAHVFFKVDGKRSGKSVVCAYRGAESGTGTPCGVAGFGGSELGVFQRNSAEIYYRASGSSCSTIQLVQVMYIKAKGPPETIVVPHNDGMNEADLGPFYQPPRREDDKDGYVVDKHVDTAASQDPYYGGSTPGSPTTPAELTDRPGNTKPNHRAYFEVCAFCSDKPGDADYGKYLDCITWVYDPDEGTAKAADPQPTEKPTPGFRGAVDLWNANHGFAMPGAK